MISANTQIHYGYIQLRKLWFENHLKNSFGNKQQLS